MTLSAHGMSDAPEYRPARRVQLDLIDIAPAPVLARLERPDNRMTDLVKMRGRVLVGGAVAAADVTAGHAEPEVNPRAAHPQAVLASVGARFDLVNLVEMAANFNHTNQPTT
jgi:hypothetical protein